MCGKKSRTKATGMKHRKPIERINANIVARLRIHVPAHTHAPMWDAPISLRVRLERRHVCVSGGCGGVRGVCKSWHNYAHA